MTRPPAFAPQPSWAAELTTRIRRYFLVNFIGTTAVITFFFIGYFYLQQHPARPVTTMPLTAVDRLIPLQPIMLAAYLSLWVYVGIGPGLQRTFRELLAYGGWMAALCVTGLAIFYFWPTQVPPLTADVANLPGFAMLRRVDAAGNACPSMHVAGAMFTAVRVHDVLYWTRSPFFLRLLNTAWFAVIVYSTLATKQHVALDAAAGALLGFAFALASLRWRPMSASAPLLLREV